MGSSRAVDAWNEASNDHKKMDSRFYLEGVAICELVVTFGPHAKHTTRGKET